MKAHIFKKAAALILALLLTTSLMPAASAYYSCDQTVITSVADGHVDKILAGINKQAFESAEQRDGVKAAVLYLLTDSAFTAVGQGRFPYLNANGYANAVSDGVYTFNVYASGCYAYAKWASQVVYGEGKTGTQLYVKAADGSNIVSTWALTAVGLKDFVTKYCQAGEHMRIDYVHSLCFLACSEEGVYFADYAGDGRAVIRLCFATWDAFFNAVRTGSGFWLSDVNTLENGAQPEYPDVLPEPEPVPIVISLTVDEPYITVDGEKALIDAQGTKPIISGGRTLLPIRAVIEAMGGDVKWDGGSKTISLSLGEKTLNLRVDSSEMWDSEGTYTIDTAPVIVGGRTMVPLRAVVEYFGAKVAWEGAARTATITYLA
ncbi:MAG: copper amine oxidase N-terminal domain-containing protein [Oscillospiraceae bacterium]|nr:copper amine oxidase N-terminal domain-containing protein [Oscillospiraceae bacterium]